LDMCFAGQDVGFENHGCCVAQDHVYPYCEGREIGVQRVGGEEVELGEGEGLGGLRHCLSRVSGGFAR
jgi:hypothetical protein